LQILRANSSTISLVTRHLCFEIPSLIDAMSLAFSQQKGAMGSQVLDETSPFHSNISGSRRAATAKARRTCMPLELALSQAEG